MRERHRAEHSVPGVGIENDIASNVVSCIQVIQPYYICGTENCAGHRCKHPALGGGGYGFRPAPHWIAHRKELYLLEFEKPGDPCKPWHECPPEKRLIIREAPAHFELLEDNETALAMGGGLGIVASLSLGSY